ncbi:MAG: aminotransferase class V-fold PLP-dependent enzyme [Candidatus Neomarinimicrobiota bacterium]|tara:strand:+ start:2874 stop:4076 length:1203 start_codon:yes stop_codon:yes gene_type:complete
MALPKDSLKSDFPIFNDSDLVYLDNASTTQKPKQVLDAVMAMYTDSNANVHRAIYDIGSKATEKFENSRKNISDFINATSEKEIIFTSGTTESINLLAHTLDNSLGPGDNILVSEMEHHANLVPWQMASERTGASLKFIPINSRGELDLSDPEKYFTRSTKIIALTHVSNVLGTINPINDIARIAKEIGALFVVDGAQGIPHQSIDVQNLGCDFYAFSGHKMLGPTGIGSLWGKMELLEEMDPFMGGGEMIENVSMLSSTWNEVPYKFEAGTPNFVQAVGLSAAIDYLNDIGMTNITKHESELTSYALEKMSQIEGLRVFGSPKNRAGVISFNIDGIHAHDLAQFLNEDNIAIRVGHHCAQPLLSSLKENSVARLSIYIYNDKSDIDMFCTSLSTIKGYF